MDLGSHEITEQVIEKGVSKANESIYKTMILSFLGGLFTSFGYLGYLRMTSSITSVAGLGHLLGSAVFPLGVIMVVIAGGELFTGNSLDVSAAFISRRIKLNGMIRNLAIVLIFNIIGSIVSAYIFGHILGSTEGIVASETIRVASLKVNTSALKAFISGVGCNILVSLGVWMSIASKRIIGKIQVLWFTVMMFVFLGFQNSVANMFVIPAAIFLNELSWLDFLTNMVLVVLGNYTGGLLVALMYYLSGRQFNGK